MHSSSRQFAPWFVVWAAVAILTSAAASNLLAQTARLAEPIWPQRFEIANGEGTGFAFVVGQPGPITVRAQWQGAPLVMSLSGPLPQPIDRMASGSVELTYNVTAADVSRSVLWKVSLRSTTAPTHAPSGPIVIDAANMPRRPIANIESQGTITVQHPPGDIKLAETQLRAIAERAQVSSQARQVRISSDLKDFANARQTLYAKNMAERQKVLAPSARQLRQAPTQPSATTTAAPAPSRRLLLPPAAPSSAVQFTAVAPPAPPTITSLSVSEGQPGDTVIVTGTGFGDSIEVHYIVRPDMDIPGGMMKVTPTTITSSVPVVEGTRDFSGAVYVTFGHGRSNFVPFHFLPSLEFKTLEGGSYSYWPLFSALFPWPFGIKGDNEYTTAKDESGKVVGPTLRNGWVVDSIAFKYEIQDAQHPGSQPSGSSGAAYVSDSRIGTDSLYVKIHYWADPVVALDYSYSVTIKGPVGLWYR